MTTLSSTPEFLSRSELTLGLAYDDIDNISVQIAPGACPADPAQFAPTWSGLTPPALIPGVKPGPWTITEIAGLTSSQICVQVSLDNTDGGTAPRINSLTATRTEDTNRRSHQVQVQSTAN